MPRHLGFRACAALIAALFLSPQIPCFAREMLLDAKTALLERGIISIEAYGKPRAAVKVSDVSVRKRATAYLDTRSEPASAVLAYQQSPDPSRSDFAFLVVREALITDSNAEPAGASAVYYRSRPSSPVARAYLPHRYFMLKAETNYPFANALLEMIGLGPGLSTVTNSTPYCVQYAKGDEFRASFLTRAEFGELADILKGFDLANFEAAGRRQPHWLLGIVVIIGIWIVVAVRRKRKQTAPEAVAGEGVAVADTAEPGGPADEVAPTAADDSPPAVN